MGDLVDALRAGELGQPVLAEVDEPQAGGELVLTELSGGVRTQDLATGGGGQQAGGAVEHRAEPVPGATLRRSGVHCHAHPERVGR